VVVDALECSSFAMKRRHALACVLATTLPVHAQRPARIGYLSLRAGPNEFEESFVRGLADHGRIEGPRLALDFRWGQNDRRRLQALAVDLVASRPDVIVTGDGISARAVRDLSSMVPMVVPTMSDPIGSGYTQSLARPDSNITGLAVFTDLGYKRVQLLKEAVPAIQCIGALVNEGNPNPLAQLQPTHAAGDALGLKVVDMRLSLPDGLAEGMANAARAGVQGIVIVSDTATISHRAQLCDAALALRLPTIFANRTYLRAGGLMSYGPDMEGAYRRAAFFVDRILKGARPADLPIEQAERLELVVSLKTARAIGITLPQTMMMRADTVLD